MFSHCLLCFVYVVFVVSAVSGGVVMVMLVYDGQTHAAGGFEAPRENRRLVARGSVSYRLTCLLRRLATILSESRSVYHCVCLCCEWVVSECSDDKSPGTLNNLLWNYPIKDYCLSHLLDTLCYTIVFVCVSTRRQPLLCFLAHSSTLSIIAVRWGDPAWICSLCGPLSEAVWRPQSTPT